MRTSTTTARRSRRSGPGPPDALEASDRGELELIFPTRKNLEALARFSSARELLDVVARATDVPPATQPQIIRDAGGTRLALPGDPDYARGRLMPAMTPEVPSALSPLVRRIVASNPSHMTGPGTNTYLVGIDEVAVIDPGPDIAKHVSAIVGASMKERVRWVLLTHTHPDHSPATAALVKATGAEVLAFTKRDPDLKVDRAITDGDTIDGTEFRLEVLHTPGHAPNHLCFFLDEERILFTGDTILDGMYSVVSPKTGGDMAKYIATLERLKKMRLAKIAPGHGDVIEEPKARIDEYLQHRLAREKQILAILKKGPARIKDIVATLYPDTPEPLIDVAGEAGARAPPEAAGRGQGHRPEREVGLVDRLNAAYRVDGDTRNSRIGRSVTAMLPVNGWSKLTTIASMKAITTAIEHTIVTCDRRWLLSRTHASAMTTTPPSTSST